ncbi:MAG: choice-of-anchor S family protein, partial [Candidatus Heimdallarchaeota archaeon]
MKKSIKGSLLFFVLIVFSGSIFAHANFSVTVGEIFTYEVVTSQWSLVQDLDSGQGSGLKYGGNPFPIGTQFTIEVLAASSSSINWE